MSTNNTLAVQGQNLVASINRLTGDLAVLDNKPETLLKVRELMEPVERNASFNSLVLAAVDRQLPNFALIVRDKEKEVLFCKVVARILCRFLDLSNITWSEDQKYTAVVDIIYHCKDWTIGDMIFFMKHIRVSGKKEFKIYPNFSPVDLLRMTGDYNEMRAAAHEEAMVARGREKAKELMDEMNSKLVEVDIEGVKKKLPLGAIVKSSSKHLAYELEKGVKPHNGLEKRRQDLDVIRMEEDSRKTPAKLAREKKERQDNIDKGTAKLFNALQKEREGKK